jgi:cell division protein FtsZ
LSEEELISPRPFASARVSIVGVGGAGNNLLNHAIDAGASPSNCVAVNTDRGQLSRSPADNKVLLDGRPLESQLSGLQTIDYRRVRQLTAHRVKPFIEASDCAILVAGLGGETATEAAPAIAQCSRTSIRPVISVVAIPFIHERERRFIALRGLKHMVDTCDSTIVIDNAMDTIVSSSGKLQADEKAAAAIQTVTDLFSELDPHLLPEILRIISLGPIACICSAKSNPGESVQATVIRALRAPSASIPLTKTTGAILLHRGPANIGDGEAQQAYEALASLIGSDIAFLHASIHSPSESIGILLTGYEYGTALRAFVNFIEDLYDVEYGSPVIDSAPGIPMSLFQME